MKQDLDVIAITIKTKKLLEIVLFLGGGGGFTLVP